MALRFTILGSGSGGNCAYLETGSTRVLLDAGFSARQIRQRLAAIGRTPETLTAILVTHEHSDHVAGLATLCGKTGIPVFANRATREAITDSGVGGLNFQTFQTGARFSLGDIEVESFSVPHDAADTVGFLLRTTSGNVGLLTDLGHATKLAVERVREANLLVLESNHDEQLLRDNPHRPWSLKQRILSRHGHLSNTAAAAVARDVVTDSLKHLFLGHLSRDCNRPELASDCMRACLDEMGASHVRLAVAAQDSVAETVELDGVSELKPRAQTQTQPDGGELLLFPSPSAA